MVKREISIILYPRKFWSRLILVQCYKFFHFQVERKRHIGNDIVNIIFMDGSLDDAARIQPQFIKSHFTHIYAIVCYVKDTDSYSLRMMSDESVPVFGPLLTKNALSTHEQFRRFLLIKLINGEKAT